MRTFPAVRLLLPAFVWLGAHFTAPECLQASPGMTITVVPAVAGDQLVRTSVPLPRGLLSTNQALVVRSRHGSEPVGLRVLSWHPVD